MAQMSDESWPSDRWPHGLPAHQVRFARPTGRLEAIVAFYCDALGLRELTRNEDEGWTVVMVGLPGDRHHFEFVAHRNGLDGTAPSSENMTVFYFEDEVARDAVAARLEEAGAPQAGFDNPWWERNGAVAYLDPDGWRVGLMPRVVSLP